MSGRGIDGHSPNYAAMLGLSKGSGSGPRASAERNGLKVGQEKHHKAASASSLALASQAHAEECPGNPAAIGTSRIISIDPAALRQVGTAQYAQTLPLRDHEIVLSFDDGPSPATTAKVLDALAAECVRANFFIVGEHAKERPDLVRRVHQEGHTIGTHSQTHADLARLSFAGAMREIDDGIQSVQAALGPNMVVAPFFRAPYLQITTDLEQFLFKRDVMLWSIDIDPQDWRPQSPEDVVEHTLTLLEKRSGIVLLHDVQPHTAAAIPILLRKLRTRGYSIVQAVATDAETKPVAISSDPATSEIRLK
jgi:peptidoglycan/xylan/chitin deacetylase (PgdA/CDA1 family)